MPRAVRRARRAIGRAWIRLRPGPAAHATCRAPHVALRLSPNGEAHPCCANQDFILGRVPEQSLREIWFGAPIAELAAALDAGNYERGCEDCATEAAAGARLRSPAAVFDRFAQPETRGWPQRLELALSNTCNLQCVMCHGDLSSAIRTQREHREPLPTCYDDQFFDQLAEFLPHARDVELIGGEPFLARETTRVIDMLLDLQVRPQVHVTTNGTVWNARVERAIRELAMNVSVSIDGVTAKTVESIRVGARHADLVRNRDAIREAVRSGGGSFTTSYCLMVDNWHELEAALREAEADDTRVFVIPVMYPAEHSLFCLPDDDLAEIAARMHEQDASLRGALDLNWRGWRDAVGRIDAHLLQAHQGAVPVALRSRQVRAEGGPTPGSDREASSAAPRRRPPRPS